MAYTDSEVTDLLDEGASTATISMRGLGLFCFNEQGAFESGFVRQSSHKYMIEIMQSGAGSSRPRLRIVDLEGDVNIEVINPARAVAHRFETGSFERAGEANNARDFRWILDLEGAEMHDRQIEPKGRMPQASGKRLNRLTINAGTFYTKQVSVAEYARVRTDDQNAPPQFLGSIAEEIGAEIECTDDDGSGLLITINNGAQMQVFLPKLSDVKYEINFNNDCPAPTGSAPDSSDFRLFYNIIRDSGGREFDLALAVDPHDPRAATGVPLDEEATKFRDGYGLVCDKVHLGRTSSLSLFS